MGRQLSTKSRTYKFSEEPLKQENCKNCGDLFYITNVLERYCTSACLEEHIRKTYKYNPEQTGRFKIFNRDDFKCGYCGKGADDGVKLSVDHIYPLSKYGENDVFNLITCCHICNSNKQAFLLPKDKIYHLWSRNLDRDEKSGLIKHYSELKMEFDIFYKQRKKN